jgi:hypothetical protein
MAMSLFEAYLIWTARALAVLLAGMVLVFLIADGGLNPLRLTGREAALMACLMSTCSGLVLAWRWPFLGGLISTVGILLFYSIESIASQWRFFNNLYFNLMLVAGILFVLGALIKRRRSSGV